MGIEECEIIITDIIVPIHIVQRHLGQFLYLNQRDTTQFGFRFLDAEVCSMIKPISTRTSSFLMPKHRSFTDSIRNAFAGRLYNSILSKAESSLHCKVVMDCTL